MPHEKSPLRKALAEGRDNAYSNLREGRVASRGVEDADALANAISMLHVEYSDPDAYGSALWALGRTSQFADDELTRQGLRTRALPELIKAYDHGIALGVKAAALLRLLHVFLFDCGEDHDAIDRAAQAAIRFPDGAEWLEITGYGYADEVYEEHPLVLERLRGTFPSGNAAIWHITTCNGVCRSDPGFAHPYDTSEGHEILRAWLDDREPESLRARRAAEALAFVSPPSRESLMRRAEHHQAVKVRIAAAFASATLGHDHGIARLRTFCEDPETSPQAQDYFIELGLEDEIPAVMRTTQHEAFVEVSDWLRQPKNGVGREPDQMSVVDTRILTWPPEDDERELCVVRYHCRETSEHPEVLEGYTMYGGAFTEVLVGEAHIGLTPLEVYALHCCLELEYFEDPRAPATRSLEAGLEILRKHNPELA